MLKTHDFVNDGGDIDGRRVIGTSRKYGYTYSEFKINGTARGNNVLALTESDDLNNAKDIDTVNGYSAQIQLSTAGYVSLDVDNDGTDENYYAEWTRGSQSINDLYEYAKAQTAEGVTGTIYGLAGELFRGITHEITIGSPTGTFAAFEAVSWSGGTGQMLAIDSTTAGTKMWIQLLTGVPPTNTQVITGASTATATASGTAQTRSLSFPFIGASTGSAIIGGYGIGITPTDLTNNDSVFDLTDTLITPPNNVTFTVAGLVSGEDYVLVAPASGTDVNGDPAINQGQFQLASALTTDNITSVQINATIPSSTPSSGTIRVVDVDGFDRRLEYSSYTGDTFTITTTNGQEDFATVNADPADPTNKGVYITYIDELVSATSTSFQGVYTSDIDLVVIVRDGGASPIKQFISAATFGSTSSTITAIRTSDL